MPGAADALGMIGVGLGLVRAAPQLLRLMRTKHARGVSLDTAATSGVVSAGWTLYGVLSDQPYVAIATGAAAVTYAAISLLAVKRGRRVMELRAAPVWTGVLLAAAAVGENGLALLLPVSVLIANAPQLLLAIRATDLSGLSLMSWALCLADGVVWSAYAGVSRDAAIAVYGLLQAGTSGGIVIQKLRSPDIP